MNNTIESQSLDELFEALLTLKTKEECYLFFEDLCTIKELTSISQRLAVAKRIKQNKTYNDISRETGASTATISRVSRSLFYGHDGYDLVFNRINL